MIDRDYGGAVDARTAPPGHEGQAMQHDPRRADEPCRCLPPIRQVTYARPAAYFATLGPPSGPILGRHRLVAVGVLRAPRDPTPIGMALALGRGDDEVEVWELTVLGIELPGRFIVVDREFRPAE
jgi:hypothetical protein